MAQFFALLTTITVTFTTCHLQDTLSTGFPSSPVEPFATVTSHPEPQQRSTGPMHRDDCPLSPDPQISTKLAGLDQEATLYQDILRPHNHSRDGEETPVVWEQPTPRLWVLTHFTTEPLGPVRVWRHPARPVQDLRGPGEGHPSFHCHSASAGSPVREVNGLWQMQISWP